MPTLLRHVKQGTIEYKKLGNRLLFPYEEGVVNEQTPPPTPEKSNVEVFLDKIAPEIMHLFEDPPEFGSVSIEVTYHNGTQVKIDCGKSIKRKV